MLAVLTLLTLIIGAVLLAHFVLGKLQERFLYTTGGEYILVGVLVGPELPVLIAAITGTEVPWQGAINREVLRQLGPLISLAIGWAGLLYGLKFDLRGMLNRGNGSFSLASVQSIATFGLVYLVCHQVLGRTGFLGLDPQQASLAALFLAATAAVSSPGALELVSRRFSTQGRHSGLLRDSGDLEELLAIFAFGLIFCLYHPATDLETGRALTPTEWYVVTVLLGVVMGVVFHFFIGDDDDENHIFLAFTGIIVFASGAAWYLQLSPLLVSLVLGIALGNTSRHARRVLPIIQRTQQPMALMLLIFAGALWTRVAWPAFVLAVLYVTIRASGKLLGGWLGAWSVGPDVRRDLGRGVLGHGEVAVAMALNLRLVYEGAFVDWIYTAVLASLVLNEFWSARLLKGLLIDAGDIRADTTPAKGRS